MHTRTATRFAILFAVNASLVTTVMLPATAQGGGGGGGGVMRFGDCSGDVQTTWILDAESTGGRIRIEAQVFEHVLDETYKWRLTDDGTTIAKGTASTNREHQDRTYFRIRRTTADLMGKDLIEFKATRVDDGEVCSGSVTL